VLGSVERYGGVCTRAISRDHKPDVLEERDRILSKSGRIEPLYVNGRFEGPPRVWLPDRDMPGITSELNEHN
jgi:hypothetical protein